MFEPPTDVLSVLTPQPATSRPAPNLLPDLAGFHVLRLVGRGGTGAVYEAYDPRLHRTVAVKVLSAAGLTDPAARRRFRQEATALGRVRHPGLVQIHAADADAEPPYLVMEFVAGESLAARLLRGPLPPAEAARLVAAAAEAVHAVHAAGLVHRDLKPGNILLSSDELRVTGGETRPGVLNSSPVTRHSSLAPKVVDFGLAKAVDAGDRLTTTGFAVGTPEYMAPEQVRGGRDIGPAADVYALGAVLYECLTGRSPFGPLPVPALFDAVFSREPDRPTGAPADLATIALKCLEKDPARRYASAAELAADLRRHLGGRPILARPISPAGRLLRWGRRNKPAAALIGGLAAALLAAGGLAVTTARGLHRERQARADADRAREEADAARRLADDNLGVARRALLDVTLRLTADDRLQDAAFTDLRRQLMAAAGPAFDRFLAQRPTDPAVRFEQALVARQAGLLELSDGRVDAAYVRLTVAADTLRELTAAPAAPAEWWRERGLTNLNLSVVVGHRKDQAGAERAVAEAADALARGPADADTLRARSRCEGVWSYQREMAGDVPGMVAHARRAVELADRIADGPATAEQRANARGAALAALGGAEFRAELPTAPDTLGAAVAAHEAHVKAVAPHRADQAANGLAVALRVRALVLRMAGRHREAWADADRAATLFDRLIAAAPTQAARSRTGLLMALDTRAASGWAGGRAGAEVRADLLRADRLAAAETHPVLGPEVRGRLADTRRRLLAAQALAGAAAVR